MADRSLLLLRVDAETSIGWGHAMRCLALAEAWKAEGGDFIFLMSHPPAPIVDRVERSSGQVRLLAAEPGGEPEVAEVLAVAKREKAIWVGLDGYHFSTRLLQAVAASNFRTLFLDDFANPHVGNFSLLVNAQLYAKSETYAALPPVALLGPQYLLLRRDFLETPPASVRDAAPLKVLITLGATRDEAKIKSVDRELARLPKSRFSLSYLAPADATPYKAAHPLPPTTEVSRLYPQFDLVISALGTTLWELLYLGVPVIALPLNEGHRVVGQLVASHRLIHLASVESLAATVEALANDLAERKRLAAAGRQFVDGKGAQRVARKMKELA